MATLPVDEPFVSVEEYLRAAYRPDCDYVDGRVEERNVAEYDHGYLQALLSCIFTMNREAWGVRALTDVRMQVKGTRFRVPDVLVLRAGALKERILTRPPLIVVEIVSPEDRLSCFQARIDDYLGFGVENIWVFDPEVRKAWRADSAGLHLIQDDRLTVSDSPIVIKLSELFAELDR